MKKILVFILSICIYSIILCSCNHSLQTGSETTQKQNEIGGEVVIESPPMHHTYDFDSYQDVVQSLTQKTSNQYSVLRKEQTNCGKIYQNTLAKFASGDIKVAFPQINKSPIPLRNREGFSNISLHTSELYNLPWLWYHCVVDGQNLDVKVSYTDAIEGFEIGSEAAYTAVLDLIAPEAPSPDNYEKYESYKTIYEKKVILKDGIVVTTMISELKNKSKVYVHFYYDGLLISLYGENELFSDAFWKSFSIAYN